MSEDDVNEAKAIKESKVGRFSNKHYIEYVTLSDDSKWVKIFRQEPDKYQEEAI